MSFYTCSDKQTRSIVNIFLKNKTFFYSVLLSACISSVAAIEIGLHFLILLFSFAVGKFFLLSLLCTFVSLRFTVFLSNDTVFLVVSPLSYEVLCGKLRTRALLQS